MFGLSWPNLIHLIYSIWSRSRLKSSPFHSPTKIFHVLYFVHKLANETSLHYYYYYFWITSLHYLDCVGWPWALIHSITKILYVRMFVCILFINYWVLAHDNLRKNQNHLKHTNPNFCGGLRIQHVNLGNDDNSLFLM